MFLCFVAFPDEPITLASKPDNSTQKNFFSNWLEKITNPIDTSELKSKDRTLKQ